jgi:purine-nucleoside phosphorylase
VPPRPVSAVHLRPSAELAERVLLPGDPHRALFVAQALLERPIMFNHRRGLWGYTGTAADGEPVTVQATGMGGASAAIVTEELIALGARRLIRIGTCGALDGSSAMGELVAAGRALAEDGASRALGADGAVDADPRLTAALARTGARVVTAVTTDLFFEPREDIETSWLSRGASVVEMEAAAVLRVATLRGAEAACALAVTDVPGAEGAERLDDECLEALGIKLGELGLAALG